VSEMLVATCESKQHRNPEHHHHLHHCENLKSPISNFLFSSFIATPITVISVLLCVDLGS
jgi:hypothetical protein